MSKVMIITNHSYMLYRFRKELIEALSQIYQDVVILMPYVGHEEDFMKKGYRCINIEMNRRGINPLEDLRLLRDYKKIIKKEKPQLVITYSIKPNIYGGLICQRLKIPYYANVQGLGTAFQKKGLSSFVTFLYKRAFKRVNCVFFENAANRDEFVTRNIISQEKTKVLNGAGINLDEYPLTPYPDHDDFHFLYLGRVMKEKGMDELFVAVKLLHEKHPFVLDIVGFFEDAYKDQVEDLEHQGIVKFHGFQENPIPFYIQADCVVLPSYHEGMSNVLLEASALGRPVITSDIPGCRESVEDRKTGLLVEVKDAHSLYQAMEDMINLSREQRALMGQNAHQKIANEFDKKIIVKETLKTLNKEENVC